jgi:hypothetical protein
MQADVANASTMPPRTHCSAERQEFIVCLRIIGSTTYRAKLAALGHRDHQRPQRRTPNGLDVSSFSSSGGQNGGAPSGTRSLDGGLDVTRRAGQRP